MKKVALCHKCSYGLWAKVPNDKHNAQRFMGCAQDCTIKDGEQNEKCPLIINLIKK